MKRDNLNQQHTHIHPLTCVLVCTEGQKKIMPLSSEDMRFLCNSPLVE